MPRMDVSVVRQVTKDDLRLLQAVELGMKNHEVVGEPLVVVLSKVGQHGSNKCLRSLVRRGLLAYVKNQRREGYRLTFFGYDALALNALFRQGVVHSVGNMIGTGKESDIYIAKCNVQNSIVIKFTRLGRNSFRQLRAKRDYHANRSHISWLYLSRISATKEYAFMKALHGHDFSVPRPLGVNRHCVVMEYIEGVNLCHVSETPSPARLYEQLIDFAVRLAQCGLVHCDFNEFNILLTMEGDPVVIDFPQAVSTKHPNAASYYERDIEAIVHFFSNRFNYTCDRVIPALEDIERICDLDVELKASGYNGTESDEEGESDNDDCESVISASDDYKNLQNEDKHQSGLNDWIEQTNENFNDVMLSMEKVQLNGPPSEAIASSYGDVSESYSKVSYTSMDLSEIRRKVKLESMRKMRKNEIRSAKAQCSKRRERKNVESDLKKDTQVLNEL